MSRTITAVDLFCGKGGWAHGLIAAGWDVDGYDIADMGGYPGNLHIADVLGLRGEDFADADLIVASPPCQFFSYTAMPWTRAKKLAADTRLCFGKLWHELRLFRACFRIQREASEAKGHHIPMVVENVVGAQAWVGRAKWHYGSFYLWGDVPALMPIGCARKATLQSGGGWFGDYRSREGRVLAEMSRCGSKSKERKEASAKIAMIPYELARWIGECYYPRNDEAVSVRTAKALCAEVL